LLEQAHNGDEAALRAAAAAQIRRAVEQKQLDLLLTWSALAAGDLHAIELAARERQLDMELLRMLAQNSLKPALRVWGRGLKNQVDLQQWRRAPCPLCGSSPTLSEIQGKEGERHLRCGMCGADWAYLRLKCAHCANSDYKSLGYITVEGEQEKYSLQTCEACHNYIKVIVTFEPTPVDLLPVEDLATLHLDLIATERGYRH
jgi:FdhE protein